MKKGLHIGLTLSLLFNVSTPRALRSWYWEPVCREIEGKDLQQMWSSSDRGDWLLWFCTHFIGLPGWPTHQQVVLAACQCARLGLKYIPPDESCPLIAIKTTEAWARGEATFDQVKCAGQAADWVMLDGDVQYFAAQAAHCAAWAVYAKEDGHCFRRAQGASGAAKEAAWATGWELFKARLKANESGSASAAAKKQGESVVLRQCADIVRRILAVPSCLTNEFETLLRNDGNA